MTAAKRLDFDLPLNGPQRLALEVLQPGNTIFLGWGRGVGKSKFGRLCWYLLLTRYHGHWRANALTPFRGIRITVLMPTLKQFKDVHWAGLVDELANAPAPGNPDWRWLGAKLDKQTGQITFRDGSSIRPFPATEYNARTALGLRTDVLVIDECDSVSESVYGAVALPWLSEPWSLGIQIIGGTPNMGRHGLWWRIYQQGVLGEKIRNGETDGLDPNLTEQDRAALATIYAFRATYKDAPETVGARTVAKAKATTPPATFRREWEADPDAGEGVVYPFEPDFHVREPREGQPWSEVIVGVDWGYAHAGAMVILGIIGNGDDAQAHIIQEVYQSGKVLDWWLDQAKAIQLAYPRVRFFCDPSQPASIETLSGALGKWVEAGDNKHEQGIARVATMLMRIGDESGTQWARLYVSGKCPNVIREFSTYRRRKDPRQPDRYLDDVEKRDDDAMDAIRYALLSRFGAPPNIRHEWTATTFG